jgi:hypothetical protein
VSSNRASFEKITLVSVTGLPDARGAAMALQHSQAQMPGARALLCSPQAPANLAPGIDHVPIAPLNYHEYGWFMMFALWRVVQTEFALVVQEDGWVVNAGNWRDEFLASTTSARRSISRRSTRRKARTGATASSGPMRLHKPDHIVTPIQNGGFSLRSRRFMRALIDHPHIRVEIPPPDAVEGEPLKMHWQHNALLEDVQLSGVLRPALEAAGMRFAPLELARSFSIEHAGPQLHHGYDAMLLFGHHAKMRQLASLSPLTLRSLIPLSQLDAWYGERDILQMFERNGYRIEFAPEPRGLERRAAQGVRLRHLQRRGRHPRDPAARAGDEVVDCFVIVEADRTFSGEPKAAAFRCRRPAHCIVSCRASATSRCTTCRSSMKRRMRCRWSATGTPTRRSPASGSARNSSATRSCAGLHDAAPDDLILISDADEIPRARWCRRMRDDRTARGLRAVPGLLLLLCELPQRRGAGGFVGVDRRGNARAAGRPLTPDQLRMRCAPVRSPR